MSSTNEEIQPHPKTRTSPLEFRNTDLVSRLLAATPPYLYNMPMVPNSYFFSEMLKSFVQAKSDSARMQNNHQHTRRPRKRSWTQSRATDYYHTETPKKETCDINVNDWNMKAAYDMKRLERPLELTTDKHPPGNVTKIPENNESKLPIGYPSLEKNDQHLPHQNHTGLFPGIQQNLSPDTNLMLPPPPPLWYPSLYPPPYGLDPLHFFIDLRVSGHIYDGKNNKDNLSVSSSSIPETGIKIIDESSGNSTPGREGFKQTRHTSAFSVPIPSSNKNVPMNLSNRFTDVKETKTRFDVKSMGFEKTSNKTSTNYIMRNISRMYKDLHASTCKSEPIDVSESSKETCKDDEKELTDEEKRVRDLRALIGLELVVDYMKHSKPKTPNQSNSEGSLSDDLDSTSDSPSVEVVVCHDEISQEI
ncbi:hypothetical protein MML48_7g00001753 [Holotrichia oblita]|uniref:Uncharacterized protein n=1 Tax=Holotrichia oblita TaxID=644536 RepID=A0ACB9SUW9_HOLOL|nr:hypothetical protein MML48_7g00001753 [Holotrichia oblita]